MKILTELCSVPTAPFVEGHVVQYVERWAKSRRRLRLSRDRFGNLLIELPGRDRRLPRWVFTAHMDHPGFIARAMEPDSRTLVADFRGGVLAEFFKGSKVRFFDDGREVVGTVTDFTIGNDRGYPESARIRVKAPVAAGSPGMWDQGEGRTKGKRFYSRVCDDLAGAAAALAMLDQLASRPPPPSTIAVLLTRAEEDGFIGAIAASKYPQLLRRSDRLIAIECSSQQPYAPQGKGAIIRVGDRTSTFHSGLTYFITRLAEGLAKADKTFAWQRALMPGGTCEATVYDVYGFTASSICVALGNYHNMDRAKKRIGPEYIDLADWRNMVKLFVEVARQGHTYEPGHKLLKERVEKRFEKLKHLLGEGTKARNPKHETRNKSKIPNKK
jgi:endoglucanase